MSKPKTYPAELVITLSAPLLLGPEFLGLLKSATIGGVDVRVFIPNFEDRTTGYSSSMAFIYMANGQVFRVPGSREAVAAGVATSPDRRLWEVEAEGFKGGNPLVKVSLNRSQVVAVTEGPLEAQ